MKLKMIVLILFALVFHKANAQYATTHYIAPSPWQYWSNANEIILTTESITPVTVTLKKSDGTLLDTRTVTSASPDISRFAGLPWNLPNNKVSKIENDLGLIIEAVGGKVSVNLRNVASDQASSSGGDTNGGTIKGNASLVSFGNEGRGTSFRLGYYRSDFNGILGFNGTAQRPIYAIMAIDNATQVKLNGSNLVLLNKGQSYLIQPNGIGDLLEANKPIVANTGAYTDAPGGCGDGTVDQMAPISILGSDYIVIRGSGTAGKGTNLPEQTTIIATEPNTTVVVKNYDTLGVSISSQTYTLALGGSFQSIHHGDAANRYSSSEIKSNHPVAVYSGTAQGCEVDIATSLPVGGCSGSKWTSTSKYREYVGGLSANLLPYFGFILVESPTDIVYVNGDNLETKTGKPRFQIGTTGFYQIQFDNILIGNPDNLIINSTARMNVGVVQQGGGFSMSGFFSSFNETPALPEVTKDSNGCAINILTADGGLEPYQWYLDGVLLPGANSQSLVPILTGNYSITGTRDCGVTGKSAAVYVSVCGDRGVTKTVSDGPGENEVIFSVVVANNGPNADSNVVVTDVLPSGYTLNSSTPTVGSYAPATGIWTVGNLAVNATATLTINATIKATGAVTNTAIVTGDNNDIIITNNKESATPLAKLTLVKTARVGVKNKVGDIIIYDLVLTNTGKVPVINIAITDINADNGSISPASVSSLAPGASVNITANHTVTQADLIASKVTNTAKAEGTDGSNNPVSDISGTDENNDTPTITETKYPIIAQDDSINGINGTVGATNVFNIYSNDQINNSTVVTPADVNITIGTTGIPTGLVLNSNGSVDVEAGTLAGTYTFDYTICEVAFPLNCATAKATVVVTTIDATNDTATPINGITGGKTPTIFDNDTLNGVDFIPADVVVSTSTPLPTGLTLNVDGTITVAPNTTLGNYPITYTICQVANSGICDTAIATVVVTTIDAMNDTSAPINGTTGGETPTIFDNDTLNGVDFIPADVVVSTSTPLPTGLTLNVDGTITVAPNTTPGTYPITYTICQVANSGICDTAIATVVVTTIDATNDTATPINGTTGGETPSIYANDTLNGVDFVPADVVVSTSTPLPTGLTLNVDGTITVAPNTTPGTYPITYTICQVANSGICDTAIATVVVTTIDATNDTATPINGTTGGKTPTIFENDTLNGVDFIPADVVVSTSTPLPTGLTLNVDGTITVAPNTAPGTYPITYIICQVANSGICDTATVTVLVQTPGIEIIKKATFNDINGDGFAQSGETITYNFDVRNTGTMSLTNVVVTDPMVTVTGGPIALDINNEDTTTFKAVYVLKQNDVDAGIVNNQALVTASPLVGNPISNTSDSNNPMLIGKNDPTTTLLTQNPKLRLMKSGKYTDFNNDGKVSVGDVIDYSFKVINTGNVTIKNIVITDPMVTVLGGPIASLEPSKTDEITFTAKYIITQADIDLGAVYNLALAEGDDPKGNKILEDSEDVSPLSVNDPFYMSVCPTCTVTILEQKSSISLIKTATFNDANNNGNAEAGETITYNFTITNTGNVGLTNVTITDPLPGIVMTGSAINLAVGQSDTSTFKGIYTIKQSDINAGKVSNQAFVTAKNPLGIEVKDSSDNSDPNGDSPTVLSIQGCIIKVFNALSLNGDNQNERFYVQGLECYPDNTVEIYNRWGVLVFDRDHYNNEERAFRGKSEGRTTIKQSDGLPVGTYFYVIKYKDSDSNMHQQAGYLFLNK